MVFFNIIQTPCRHRIDKLPSSCQDPPSLISILHLLQDEGGRGNSDNGTD